MVADIIRDQGVSLREALRLSGCSRRSYYHQPGKRTIPPDPYIFEKVREEASKRPLYGTRRMAVTLARRLGRPINRKRIQRIYRILGWIEPQKTKKQLLRATYDKRPKPTRPNELWASDLTYIHCGIDGWAYLFNVEDVVSREWVSYVFDRYATKENAILTVEKALIKHPDALGVRLRTDRGPQYESESFRESMRILRVKQEFIAVNTPEQNGHMESFHKTLKREYVWTRDFQTFQEAAEAIQEAYVDYNQHRIHSALGYLAPYEYLGKLKVTKNDL
jgi:transposase InsO family protein